MNQGEDYTYLIFDKAVENDHSYTNKITSKISIGDMFMSNHKYFEGIEAINEFNKFKELDKIETNLDTNLYKPYLFSYLLNGAKVKITIFAINNKILENYVKNKTQIPNKKFFISLCNANILYEKVSSGVNLYSSNVQNEINNTVNSIITTVSVPNALLADPIEEQPSYCAIPLFEYQKKTIKWMLQRETNSVEIYYNPNDELILGNIVYDSGDQNFVSALDRKKLTFCGGALIDEMGLGKTYQMMTLALQNQAKNINYIQRNLKMLFSRATLVLCPNHLGAQWCDELLKLTKKDYGLNIVKLFTKIDYEKCTYSDILDADFVIVTFQFLDKDKVFQQLFRPKISESKSYFSSSKSTYNYLETQTVLDELGINALENSNIFFQTFPNLLLVHWHRIVIDEFHEIFTLDKYFYMQRLICHFKGDKKWCMSGTPFNDTTKSLLSMFDFVTNFVNEIGDQIILNKNVNSHLITHFFRKNTKLSINNEYTLPTPIENTIFLNFSTTEWMMYNAYLANPTVDKGGILMRQLCCHPGIADEIKSSLSNCKTLKDIETVMVKLYESQMVNAENKLKFAEYKLKTLMQKIKIITFKRQARFLRKYYDYRVKIEFGLENLNKEEIQKLEKYFANDPSFLTFLLGNDDEMAEDSEDEVDLKKELIIVSDETQHKIQKILSKDKEYKNTSKTILDLKDTENNMLQQIELLKKDFEGKKSTSNYFNDVLARLKKTTEITDDNVEEDGEENEQCGICLGDIKGNDLGVTKCGHIFCYNCVKPFIYKKPSCPVCSKPTKIDELYMIAQPPPEENLNKDFKDKQTLINAVGTKLANLIFFLKKNDKHCIIFSQWDDLLLKVGDVLNNYGIRNVFCKGNVWTCTKAINDFNSNTQIKVIMLSSKSSASGMNLTKAEMVILLDPVSGSYKDRRNTEWQAIGRAVRTGQTKQVQIVRFIMKNTIEDDIYKENMIENAKQVENIKIYELDENATQLDEETIEKINKCAKESKPKKPTKKMAKKAIPVVEEIFEDDGDY